MIMADGGHARVRDLRSFTDPDAALRAVAEIYDAGCRIIHDRFERFVKGERTGDPTLAACYPYLGITVELENLIVDHRPAFGTLPYAGTYGTTLTRPDVFADYYREQIELLVRHHKVPVVVGVSDRRMPLLFVLEGATAQLAAEDLAAVEAVFALPRLAEIDDGIANGTHQPVAGAPLPLSLFTAERVDLALQRLVHYTATSPKYFQNFVLFTNYQRYVTAFVTYGRRKVTEGDEYLAFVEPGDVVTPNPRLADPPVSGTPPAHLSQMPAYHLVRGDKLGITLVNIGVGPSNAKNITDHIAVLRPHAWIMLGHCAGLRTTQQLGDYVLAHGYVREDHVLDEELPLWVPIPPLAEVQVAIEQAVADVTHLSGLDLKRVMRTGTVASTDNRNWELLPYPGPERRFSQSRAIALDMESATIAANGFRFRIPYGTLLCVSDKPLHGEIKLPGMANHFYRERVEQHLRIGIRALEHLRGSGVDRLHSRKLRGFAEVAFQ
jgi:AMP nucleosidase